MATQGPSLQGQITINTKSVDQAIRSVATLGGKLEKMSADAGTSSDKVARGIQKQEKSYTDMKKSVDSASGSLKNLIQNVQKQENLIAKAANKVAAYEASVRKSNLSQKQQAELIARAGAELKGYEAAVRNGATSGQQLQNINTQLTVSMAQLSRESSLASTATRDMARAQTEAIAMDKQRTSSLVATEKSVLQATSQFNRMKATIQASAMSDREKAAAIQELKGAHNTLTSSLRSTQATTMSLVQSQAAYKASLDAVANKTRAVNAASKGKQLSVLNNEFKNLTSSVVVALGPLSGVASRLVALQGLFNRNTSSLAAAFAGMTAFTVGMLKSANAAETAEKQMLRINSQLATAGNQAQVTGAEINAMAHIIASQTLLSANEVRDASSALIEFGGIARSQFGDTIITAQGMSAVFKGSLRQNIKKLGLAIEDPVRGLQRLQTSGKGVTDEVKEQILTLHNQGRRYEATSLLLKELNSLHEAAINEAKGLSGAYDTVSGNLDKLYEDLFNTSGALKGTTKGVNEVATAIKDFSGSMEADVISKAFADVVKSVSGGATFLIENIKLLSLIFITMAASTIPKLIGTMGKLLLAVTGFTPALRAKAAAWTTTTLAINTTSVAAQRFKTTMSFVLGPIAAVAFAVAGLVAVMRSYKALTTDAASDRRSLTKAITQGITDEIALNNKLGKEQSDQFREKQSVLEKTNSEIIAGLEKHEKAVVGANERIAAAEDRSPELKKLIEGAEHRLALMQKHGKPTEKQTKLLEELKSEQRELAVSEKEAREQSEKSSKIVTALTEKRKELHAQTEKLRIAVKSGTEEEFKREAVLIRAKRAMGELSAEFLKHETAVKSAEAQVKKARDALDVFRTASGDNTKEIAQMSRVLAAAEEALASLKMTKASQEAQKFADSLRNASEKADDLEEVLSGVNTEAAVALNREMTTLSATLMSMKDPEALKALAKELGDESLANDVNALTEAYITQMRADLERQRVAQQGIDNKKIIKQNLASERSELTQLIDKYKELRDTAEPKDLKDLKDSEDKETAALMARGKDIAGAAFTNFDSLEEDKKRRAEILAEMFGQNEEQLKEHMDNMKEIAKKQKPFLAFAKGAEVAAEVVGQSMEIMQNLGRENSKKFQSMAIAQAVIQQALAVADVWGSGGKGMHPMEKIGWTALAAAQVGSQIAAIRSQSFATGGLVSGAGTGTSDSIAAMLSNGEFVMRADAVKKIGLQNLERMNAGATPHRATGGLIGTTSGGGVGSNVNIQIIDQSSGNKSFTTEEGTDASGARQIKIMVRDAVKEAIVRGDVDREMGSRFGVRSQGRRV